MVQFINYSLMHMWQGLKFMPGYEVSAMDTFYMLKSPTLAVNLNICVNPTTADHMSQAQNFFQGKDFGSIETPGYKWPSLPLKAEVELIEMHLSTKEMKPLKMPSGVCPVKDPHLIKRWAEIMEVNFGLSQHDLALHAEAVIQLEKSILFCAEHEGQIVGTAQVYIDDQNLAYISAISVLPEYRRLGIGAKLMQASVSYSLDHEAKLLGLHASEMGKFLYEKLHFKPIKSWSFKIIDNTSKT